MKNNVIAIIPARGGSKGVPRKNMRMMAGKPLIVYSIEVAKKSKYFDKIFVSTENKEIAKISQEYDVEIIKRPEELALDDVGALPVIKHALAFLEENKKYKPEIIVILQPTSPLRNKLDITNCIDKLVQEKCDSVITVKKIEQPLQWMLELDDRKKVNNLSEKKIVRRQEYSDVYIPNGAVYATWRKTIMDYNDIRGEDTRAVIMPEDRSIDIDTELDFFIAEKLIEKENK